MRIRSRGIEANRFMDMGRGCSDSHILIKSLKPRPEGEIIAAALDGDGDRCLLIESTGNGCKVVDGDEMADHILRSAKGNWHLAASIESDLALATSLKRLNAKVNFSQTAVGDRWLSHALKDSKHGVLGRTWTPRHVST